MNKIAFSPDGKRLAAGGSLGSGGSVWDAATGKKLFSLSGHVGSINSLVYSPDGTRIATGSVDGMVKLWDAATGREPLTLARQKAEVKGVAFSPDGRRLAAVTVDGTARVYLLRTQDLMAQALARVTRSLTAEECQKYLHQEQCPSAP